MALSSEMLLINLSMSKVIVSLCADDSLQKKSLRFFSSLPHQPACQLNWFEKARLLPTANMENPTPIEKWCLA